MQTPLVVGLFCEDIPLLQQIVALAFAPAD
jgi:hypothetical protein